MKVLYEPVQLLLTQDLQVLFQDQCFKLLNGLAHCIRLAQNVNAILVLFDHLANTTNVSLDVVEPLEYILLVSTHLSSPLVSPLPAGYGGSLPQIWHPCKYSRLAFTLQRVLHVDYEYSPESARLKYNLHLAARGPS